MIITGKHSTIKIFTNNVDETTQKQILDLANFEPFKDSKIRVMPDCHAGVGCVVGTTMTIIDKISPSSVGVDIGCGMLAVPIKLDFFDDLKEFFKALDVFITKNIPFGFNVNNEVSRFVDNTYWIQRLKELVCYPDINNERAILSLSSLGGGNHFIEIDKSERDSIYYLVIHSGSRHLGVQVAKYYRDIANKICEESGGDLNYIEGENLKNYLHDMEI